MHIYHIYAYVYMCIYIHVHIYIYICIWPFLTCLAPVVFDPDHFTTSAGAERQWTGCHAMAC